MQMLGLFAVLAAAGGAASPFTHTFQGIDHDDGYAYKDLHATGELAEGVVPLHLEPSVLAADCRVPGTLRLTVNDLAPALAWPAGSLLVGDHKLGCLGPDSEEPAPFYMRMVDQADVETDSSGVIVIPAEQAQMHHCFRNAEIKATMLPLGHSMHPWSISNSSAQPLLVDADVDAAAEEDGQNQHRRLHVLREVVEAVKDTVKDKVLDYLPNEATLDDTMRFEAGSNLKKNELAASTKKIELVSSGPWTLSCYKCYYGVAAGLSLQMTIGTISESPYVQLESMEMYAVLEASVKGELAFGASYTKGLTAGYRKRYASDGFHEFAEETGAGLELYNPILKFKGGVSMEAGIIPQINIKLWETFPFRVKPKPHVILNLGFGAELSDGDACSADSGDSAGGVKTSLFYEFLYGIDLQVILDPFKLEIDEIPNKKLAVKIGNPILPADHTVELVPERSFGRNAEGCLRVIAPEDTDGAVEFQQEVFFEWDLGPWSEASSGFAPGQKLAATLADPARFVLNSTAWHYKGPYDAARLHPLPVTGADFDVPSQLLNAAGIQLTTFTPARDATDQAVLGLAHELCFNMNAKTDTLLEYLYVFGSYAFDPDSTSALTDMEIFVSNAGSGHHIACNELSEDERVGYASVSLGNLDQTGSNADSNFGPFQWTEAPPASFAPPPPQSNLWNIDNWQYPSDGSAPKMTKIQKTKPVQVKEGDHLTVKVKIHDQSKGLASSMFVANAIHFPSYLGNVEDLIFAHRDVGCNNTKNPDEPADLNECIEALGEPVPIAQTVVHSCFKMSENCTLEMLLDPGCDAPCKTPECGWDMGACSQAQDIWMACTSAQSCSECLNRGPNCGWCTRNGNKGCLPGTSFGSTLTGKCPEY